MILPDNYGVKIILFGAIGIIGPFLSIRERNRLSKESRFGLKWRKIKLVEAISEMLLGTIGVVLCSHVYKNIKISEKVYDGLFVIAFILMVFIGFIKDAYIKAEKKNKEES